MTVAMTPEQTWTAASIDAALVRINTVLARLRRRPGGPSDELTTQAIEDARQLKLHLEQNPSVCTADGLACCSRLLEVQVV